MLFSSPRDMNRNWAPKHHMWIHLRVHLYAHIVCEKVFFWEILRCWHWYNGSWQARLQGKCSRDLTCMSSNLDDCLGFPAFYDMYEILSTWQYILQKTYGRVHVPIQSSESRKPLTAFSWVIIWLLLFSLPLFVNESLNFRGRSVFDVLTSLLHPDSLFF